VENKNPRILILGGGFSGIYTAYELQKRINSGFKVDVTLVSRNDSFLFTPMLHEVVSGALSSDDVAIPIKEILKNINFVCGEVLSVDLENKTVKTNSNEIFYDHVVFALGVEPNFFGMKNVQTKSLCMKSIDDAQKIRTHIETCFDRASQESDQKIQKKLLTFIVAGGGFTGVETLGAIYDLTDKTLRKRYGFLSYLVRIILIHPGDIIISEMKAESGLYAQNHFEKQNVEIKLKSRVVDFSDQGICLESGEVVESETLIWTAGNKTGAIIEGLNAKKQRGRIVVDDCLRVEGLSASWALGDCAYISNIKENGVYPPTAQHATREAKIVARNIIATMKNKENKSFSFDSLGQLANIGRRKGIANILGIDVKGFIAWILWHIVYLIKLPSFKNKKGVIKKWIFS